MEETQERDGGVEVLGLGQGERLAHERVVLGKMKFCSGDRSFEEGLDAAELPQAQHRDDAVAFLPGLPDMRDKGRDDDHIYLRKRLFACADDMFSGREEHQVDLVFRMAVDGVVELGVLVVQNHEQIVALYRRYFLLDVLHRYKCS